jgi:hypothetical protein
MHIWHIQHDFAIYIYGKIVTIMEEIHISITSHGYSFSPPVARAAIIYSFSKNVECNIFVMVNLD